MLLSTLQSITACFSSRLLRPLCYKPFATMKNVRKPRMVTQGYQLARKPSAAFHFAPPYPLGHEVIGFLFLALAVLANFRPAIRAFPPFCGWLFFFFFSAKLDTGQGQWSPNSWLYGDLW